MIPNGGCARQALMLAAVPAVRAAYLRFRGQDGCRRGFAPVAAVLARFHVSPRDELGGKSLRARGRPVRCTALERAHMRLPPILRIVKPGLTG